MGLCCMAQETQTGALNQPRGVGWGGRFKREGTYVYLWLIHVDVWKKPTKFCKAIILQLREKKKAKIMASGPITSWQIDGETKKTVTNFIFLGSKITADDDYTHEIKRHLLLGRKAMTNLVY